MPEINIIFKNYGSLTREFDAEIAKLQGVYMFVFNGNPKRIIYIGTAYGEGGFRKRWLEHFHLFQVGGRFVFKAKSEQDIYSLMQFKGHPNEYYKILAMDGLLWNPDTNQKDGIFLDFYTKKNDYTEKWLDFVNNNYLPFIELWACEVSEKIGLILETKLQISIGKYYHIGYYKGYSQNWLGHQESKNKKALNKYSFNLKLENFDGFDSETKALMANFEAVYQYYVNDSL